MAPREAIMMVAFAESSFARSHPETGFTCTLADLAKSNPLNLDPRIFSGEPYRGYKFSLSGCQDKPSGSFRLDCRACCASGWKLKPIALTQPTISAAAMTAWDQAVWTSGKPATFSVRRRSGWRRFSPFHNKAIAEVILLLQKRIGFALFANGRDRPVSGYHFCLIRQRQHLRMQ